MDIYLLDEFYEPEAVIDSYKSIIWTRRFYEPGDFELYILASSEIRKTLYPGRILYRDKDKAEDGTIKSAMIVEKVQLVEDADSGDMYAVSGRDLKSILYRRVVWGQRILSGYLEAIVQLILKENVISPSIAERKIDNFVLAPSIGLTNKIETQLYGDNIGKWISDICTSCRVGWDVTLKDGNFVFTLCQGTDHSFSQSDNPWVVFASDYDNLLTSEYDVDWSNYHNVAFVSGEGEGTAKKTTSVGTATGLDRYELYVDGSGVSTNSGEVTASQYETMLKQEGITKLYETNHAEERLENEVDAKNSFVLGVDYDLGDIVQIHNSYGYEAAPRITEAIESEDESGTKLIPTFSTMTSIKEA